MGGLKHTIVLACAGAYNRTSIQMSAAKREQMSGKKNVNKNITLTNTYVSASKMRHLHTIDFAWPYVNQFLELGYNLQFDQILH